MDRLWTGTGTYQDGVLHVVPQQARVVERVLGLLHLGVHGALLHLVLQGLEELVERFSSRVLGDQTRFSFDKQANFWLTSG